MKTTRHLLQIIFLFTLSTSLFAQTSTIEEKTKGMTKYEGYFNFYWDQAAGKIWLEIDKLDTEVLYLNAVTGGLGANGIDRNSLGQSKLVAFHRVGPKILMIQPNYSFRANSDDEFAIEAVENAFGKSIIWGFVVAAEEGQHVLVDATKFLLRDVLGGASLMGGRNSGAKYSFDESKSAFDLSHTKNFPYNSEFDVMLTFTGQGFRGSEAPSSEAITLRLHHSLVKLPDNNFEPRKYDPRSSFMSSSYLDFSTPFSEDLKKSFISRHRLEKKNPGAKISEAVDPIVYYVDRGVPDEIKAAVLEGAAWWNHAFEACGYKDAFQVKLLPEDADAMDIRYNMVNWVNRSSRGWSYGSAISDPRTGEIIKGNVSMGALRIRQVYLMLSSLAGEYGKDNQVSSEIREMALLRIKQLSAHEVGHTLGLVHSYAANVNERSSVMDYPHALAMLNKDGSIDISKAYTSDIGAWDKASIAYGYQDFPEGVNGDHEASKELDQVLKGGLLYLSDRDAGANIHPLASQWDNGAHPVTELERVMKIRKIALENFSEKKIRYGQALSTLEDVLVPVYFYHRYQITASAGVLGGLYYNHALRGGPQYVQKYVPAEEQKQALKVLLSTIDPTNLLIEERILKLIPPRAPGHSQTEDLFSSYTGGTFDPLAAAENIADLTVGLMLNPSRAARLIHYHSLDQNLPGLDEVIEELLSSTFRNNPKTHYEQEIQRVVNQVVLNRLIALIADKTSSSQSKAIANLKLQELKLWLGRSQDNDPGQKAHLSYCLSRIEQFEKNPGIFQLAPVVKIPNGAPIGN